MSNRLLQIFAGICAMALICMIAALSITGKPTQAPFVPPDFDATARKGQPEVPAALDWQTLDAQVFTVGICGVLIPEESSVDIWLANPEDNAVWLKIRILDGSGAVLGESGLVRPGEYVQTVSLRTVPAPETAVTLKIMAYEPDTYRSAGAVSLYAAIS